MLVYNKKMEVIEKYNKKLFKPFKNIMVAKRNNIHVGFGIGIYRLRPVMFFVSSTANNGDYAKQISWRKYFKIRKEL